MAWKPALKTAYGLLKQNKLQEALSYLDTAIASGANEHLAYDTRASTLEKLGRYKEALKDSKRSIDIHTTQWQAYARSARLFLKIGKPEPALAMVELAFTNLELDSRHPMTAGPHDKAAKSKRVSAAAELEKLKSRALNEMASARKLASDKAFCHISKLPFELLTQVITYLVVPNQAAAFTVASVCKYWRALALGASRFWHTVILNDRRAGLQKASAVLIRSGGRIIELCLHESMSSRSDQTVQLLAQVAWETLRTLRVYAGDAERCRAIVNAATSHSSQPILIKLDELDMQAVAQSSSFIFNLQNDVYLGQRRADAGNPDNVVAQDPISSNLTQLTLRHFVVDVLSMPRGGLTRLVLDQCIFRGQACHLHDVLAGNVGLEFLVLRISLITMQNASVNPPALSLPKLASLELRCSGSLNPLFAALTLPVLRSLRLAALVIPADTVLAVLGGSTAGFARLEELYIEQCSVKAPNDILALIRNMHHLRALELTRIGPCINALVGGLSVECASEGSDTSQGAPSWKIPCSRLAHVNFSHCPDLRTSPIVSLVKAHLSTHRQEQPQVASADESALELIRPQPRASKGCARIVTLVVDGCPLIEAESLPWLRQQVHTFSCRYMSKKEAGYRR